MSQRYEVWQDDVRLQVYDDKDAAVQHARRMIDAGERDIVVWDLSHTRIGVKRLGNLITDPRRVDLRPRGVHFRGGRAINHGS